MALTLGRRPGEYVLLETAAGEEIRVRVEHRRLVIDAPDSVRITRGELTDDDPHHFKAA